MNREEKLKSVLKYYYPYIDEFLGEIIEQRLKTLGYENGVLTSQLLTAARKAPVHNKDEYLEDEELESESFELDSDLYNLEETLGYGEEHCKGFNLIFQNINLAQYQDADTRIMEILAQVKAFEFLSKLGFRHTTKVDQQQNKLPVDFVAYKSPEYYAIVVTRLYSAQYIEDHRTGHDSDYVIKVLKTDINNAINQKCQQMEEFCRSRVGIHRGIVFISSGRDYFGNKKHENRLYGLPLIKIIPVLNKEWVARKGGQERYKYLHHIVITTGRNVRKAIIYPRLN